MSYGGRRLWVWIAALAVAACSSGSRASEPTTMTAPSTATTAATSEPQQAENSTPQSIVVDLPEFFTTLTPGSSLPESDQCGEAIRERGFGTEKFSINADPNQLFVEVYVDIDGASEETNARFAPRVTGDFTGTTEEILVWGACKWGFDEDITRARAVAESSWKMTTFGDPTTNESECALIDLEAPCNQSYGLLQVKGSVHLGTYPYSKHATAFGVDYALSWLRSCYEGSFTWLKAQGYEVGDEWGCVGAWFSGNWYDNNAKEYIAVVKGHLENEIWLGY